jgi:hypothetical protein
MGGLAALAIAGAGQAAPLSAPAPHRTLTWTIVNDGAYVVSSVQVRAGRGGWGGNILEEPVATGQIREFQIADVGRPCIVDLAVNTLSPGMDVFLFEQNICEHPDFRVSEHFDPRDEAGRGRGGRGRPSRAAPDMSPSPWSATEVGLERGVPLCPGDARCKKKK